VKRVEVFKLEKVNYKYAGKINALNSINLTIKNKDSLSILGSNGSGKSTLLKLLDCLIFADSGEFKAFGRSINENIINDDSEFQMFFRRRVGFVFQNSEAQLFCPTVLEEVQFGPAQLEIEKNEIEKRVNDVIEILNIKDLKYRAPYSLSEGEKKKVAIASVLSINPEVLLMDEPTNGLDPKTREWLIDFLIELKGTSKTLVIATQDLELAEMVTQRGVVLGEDHLIARDGKLSEIVRDYNFLKKVNLIGNGLKSVL